MCMPNDVHATELLMMRTFVGGQCGRIDASNMGVRYEGKSTLTPFYHRTHDTPAAHVLLICALLSVTTFHRAQAYLCTFHVGVMRLACAQKCVPFVYIFAGDRVFDSLASRAHTWPVHAVSHCITQDGLLLNVFLHVYV